MALDPNALANCRCHIEDDFGNLDDISPKLADAITNTYYQYALFCLSFQENSLITRDFLIKQRLINNDLKYARGIVERFREASTPMSKPEEYLITYFALDTLVYRIPNAGQKSGLRRLVEKVVKGKPKGYINHLYQEVMK